MTNRDEFEKLLVTEFCNFVARNGNESFAVSEIHHGQNGSGDTIQFADIELTSTLGELIAIEAKTHETRDAPNTVHKVFGQLLAERGKTNPRRKEKFVSLGILIPAETPVKEGAPKEDGKTYYQRRFRNIPKDIFKTFGILVNAKYIFVFQRTPDLKLDVYRWMDFHRDREPFASITEMDLKSP